MTRLEKLNRKMLALEQVGQLSQDEYSTYKDLLEWKEFTQAHIGDRLPLKEARPLILKFREES